MPTDPKLSLIERRVVPVGTAGVFARTITGREYKIFNAQIHALKEDAEEVKNIGAVYALVWLTACDEHGRQLFASLEETSDVTVELAKAIFEVAADLNGLVKTKDGEQGKA